MLRAAKFCLQIASAWVFVCLVTETDSQSDCSIFIPPLPALSNFISSWRRFASRDARGQKKEISWSFHKSRQRPLKQFDSFAPLVKEFFNPISDEDVTGENDQVSHKQPFLIFFLCVLLQLRDLLLDEILSWSFHQSKTFFCCVRTFKESLFTFKSTLAFSWRGFSLIVSRVFLWLQAKFFGVIGKFH